MELLELFGRCLSPHTFDLVSDFFVGLLQFIELDDDVFDQGFDLIHIFFQRVLLVLLLSRFFSSLLGCPLSLDEGNDVVLTILADLRDLFDIDLDLAECFLVGLDFLGVDEGYVNIALLLRLGLLLPRLRNCLLQPTEHTL